MTHLTAVAVPDLLRWASQIDDEIDLDGVSAALRGAANDPDADPIAAITAARSMGEGNSCCSSRHLCSYHEGWSDALDVIEGGLS